MEINVLVILALSSIEGGARGGGSGNRGKKILSQKQGVFGHEGAYRWQVLVTCKQIKDCAPILSSIRP